LQFGGLSDLSAFDDDTGIYSGNGRRACNALRALDYQPFSRI